MVIVVALIAVCVVCSMVAAATLRSAAGRRFGAEQRRWASAHTTVRTPVSAPHAA